jgi:PEP-CTERM motif
MNKTLVAITLSALSSIAAAHETTYNITTEWYEPQTQPKNTVFQGSFVFDEHTGAVTGLQGMLSESMTGTTPETMTWLTLSHQLVTWKDTTLGGTFAAVFKNASTATFWTGAGGDGWSPEAGIAVGGVHHGFPLARNNPGNAYALIFVPNNPTAALNASQIAKLAYADCAPGGMMQAACMTGTSVAGYGSLGTMDGYPVSQTITAAVPEPATYLAMLGGLGLIAGVLRRRTAQA